MARHYNGKGQVLRLYELLLREAEADRPMTTDEILLRMGRLGYAYDRRRLAKDIALLKDEGYPVACRRMGTKKGYFIEGGLSGPDIDLLAEAVRAAGSLSQAQVEDLLEKLARLRGGVPERPAVFAYGAGHIDEDTRGALTVLRQAIALGRRVRFRCFEWDEDAQKDYFRGGSFYTAAPVALIQDGGVLAMLAYSAKDGLAVQCRVDRMDAVTILDEAIDEKAASVREALREDPELAEELYAGKRQELTLRFHPALLTAVYDRFGPDAKIRRLDAWTLEAVVTTRLDESFWQWMTLRVGQVQVLSPASVAEAFEERTADLVACTDRLRQARRRQKQAEGIAAAKAQGMTFGRKPKSRPAEYETLLRRWKNGEISARYAADLMGVTHQTFLKWTKEPVE